MNKDPIDTTNPRRGEDPPGTSIIADTMRPCAVCGCYTPYVDYCYEIPLCSKHCQDAYTDMLFPKEVST